MDDVALIHQDKEELKRMLNSKWIPHQVWKGKKPFNDHQWKNPNTEITIGEQVLEKKQYVQIPRYDHK